MRLLRLEFTNFGPFKGDQHIDFGRANGVSVIYGDNNLGKTTVLNSVRWLFVGRFLERTGKERPHAALVNREAIAEAHGRDVTTRVRADVEWGGENYTLSRSLTRSDDRLVERLDVIRGSDALSREAAETVLRQMIPEEIQQFFLFDAEALNRYEDLLHDPTAGDELKKAIERILGVPVLKNGVDDLKALIAKHNKLIAKLETQNVKAQAAAESLAQLNEVIDRLAEDRSRIEADIARADETRQDVESRMEATETARRLLEQERAARAAVALAETHHDTTLARYRDAAPKVWQAVITSTLQGELVAVRDQLAELERDQGDFERDRLLEQLRAEIRAGAPCPCCGQESDGEHLATTHGFVDHSPDIERLRRRERALEVAADPTAVVLISERWRALEEAAAGLHDARSALEDAEDAVAGIDDTDLVDLPRQLGNAKEQLRILRANLRETDRQLEENRTSATKLAAIVAEEGGAAGAEATRKQALLTDIQQLLSSAIDRYRENLKTRVEAEATEVFLSMRSDPDFVGLSINDDYGLSILHADGEVEPHRSSGYEHIVALSLVAALQRCAPVQGPIFMDMPFARLDPNHTLQTLRALPAVADQLILIVHEGEIDHTEAVNTLGTSLVLERKLVRRSARHTEIEPLGGS